MERNMKPAESCKPSSGPFTAAMTMHKDSHVISKFKPKVRIIHIFAPEIIETDAENFRELVQRLTGKPLEQKGSCKKKRRSVVRKDIRNFYDKPSKTMEVQHGFPSFLDGELIKEEEEEEEETWKSEKSSRGFLDGFTDLDGFIQELTQFPLLPLKSSHMDMFGEIPLS